jgi:hypothetical protein
MNKSSNQTPSIARSILGEERGGTLERTLEA